MEQRVGNDRPRAVLSLSVEDIFWGDERVSELLRIVKKWRG
jgi:hypothetical protein